MLYKIFLTIYLRYYRNLLVPILCYYGKGIKLNVSPQLYSWTVDTYHYHDI